MKASEFINEMRVGSYMSGGVTPARSSIEKRNASAAYDLVKSIGNAPTPKDKIEIISNLKSGEGNTSNKIVIKDSHGKPYKFTSYDKNTGNIELISMKGMPCRTNVSSLTYVGKERSASTTLKKWIFSTDDIEASDAEKPKAPVKTGRPKKVQYTIPNSPWGE